MISFFLNAKSHQITTQLKLVSLFYVQQQFPFSVNIDLRNQQQQLNKINQQERKMDLWLEIKMCVCVCVCVCVSALVFHVQRYGRKQYVQMISGQIHIWYLVMFVFLSP